MPVTVGKLEARDTAAITVSNTGRITVRNTFTSEQLVANSSFDDGTTSWSSSTGFQTVSGGSGSKPGVSGGALRFSQTPATVSQTALVPSGIISEVSQFVAVLNIVRVNNGAADTFSFTVTQKDSADNTLATQTTGIIAAPSSATDYTFTQTRAGAAYTFNDIAKVTVAIYGVDGGNWAGNYGPVAYYATVTAE